MSRFSERQLEWTDIIGRFEASPHSTHLHTALGIVGALKEEGARFWDRDSEQFLNWQRYCTDLWAFLNSLGERRDLRQQRLETAMREFIQVFEHSTGRMYQMLYGRVVEADGGESLRSVMDWFNVTYLASKYALVSAWIDDKQENISLSIRVDLTTGNVRQEGTRTKMRVPKKYQSSTRRL